MATSAPSLAKRTATARPIPLSPPVMIALRPDRRRQPPGSPSLRGRGAMAASRPGWDWRCGGTVRSLTVPVATRRPPAETTAPSAREGDGGGPPRLGHEQPEEDDDEGADLAGRRQTGPDRDGNERARGGDG